MLKVFLHEPRSLRWWYEQYRLGNVEMSPKYQRRGEVWSRFKRAHLIDSLLNDFDVPKFYVADFGLTTSRSLNPTHTKYAIIDGKQRFGAIFSYFEDQLALNPSFALDDDASLAIGKWLYSDLAIRYPSLTAKVDNFIPTVMNVVTDDETKIEELFVRLNAGEAATGAERRNALGGPVPVITRELSDHVFFARRIRFNVKRMQEHNLIQKLLLFEFKDGFVDTKARNLDDFANEAKKWDVQRSEREREQEDLGPYAAARDRAYETLDLLAVEFEDRDILLSRQGEIPIYYWAARQHPTWVNELRDFVLLFSEQLLETLREQRENPRAGDPELAVYYTSSRTTNDQQSLLLRYRIFQKRFAAFRRPGGRRS